jgi:large subunit ribosomal protein L10
MNQEILKAKVDVVNEVLKIAKSSKSIIVVEYRKMTVSELSDLRRTLRGVKATLAVYKNTLVKRATDKLGYTGLEKTLTGPNAFVFSPDPIEGPKFMIKYARKNDKIVIKGGVIEGSVVNAAGIKTVAGLPGRNGLISMFLSCLQAPIRQFAATVQAVADHK